MAIEHTIRMRHGKKIEVETIKLTPLTAIVRLCRDCLGFEDDPENCTSPLCPVFPFRTGSGHSGKTISPENRARAAEWSKNNVQSSKTGQKTD